MERSKWYGLALPKKAEKLGVKKKSVFESDGSDDDSKKNKRVKKKPLPQSKKSNVAKKNEEIDPSIYEYDNIYDEMKATEAQNCVLPKGKEPRYIGHLLKAAEKRKKDNERRVEKKIQDERVKEGNEYADKESFVTSAYHKKMLEMEEEEKEEQRKKKLEEMMDVTKQKDLSGFYRHFLRQTIGEEKVPELGEWKSKKNEVKGSCSTTPLHYHEKSSISKSNSSIRPNTPGSKSNSIIRSNTHDSNKPKVFENRDILSKYDDDCSPDMPVCIKSENIDSDEKCSSSSSDSEKGSIDMERKADRQGEGNFKNIIICEKSDCKDEGNFKDMTMHEKSDVKENENFQNNMKKFEKRTIGVIFEEAQARYFKRRNASKSK